MSDPGYLIRYGSMGYVGRFRASAACEVSGPLRRGQSVVIRSDRGIELGEILVPLDEAGAARAKPAELQEAIRPAGPDDLARARVAEATRPDRLAVCRRVLDEAGWPWEILDVELMLEGGLTVIQYLGPPHPDPSALRARFRMTCDLDVVLEPIGGEPVAEPSGCGSGGGCGTGGGCSSCGLKARR